MTPHPSRPRPCLRSRPRSRADQWTRGRESRPGAHLQPGRGRRARQRRAGVRVARVPRREPALRADRRCDRAPAELCRALAAEVAATPLPVWKAYLRLGSAGRLRALSRPGFVAARFAFCGTALSGHRPRSTRAGSAAWARRASTGEALGQAVRRASTFRRSRRRAWRCSSPTCSPPIARASTRSTG